MPQGTRREHGDTPEEYEKYRDAQVAEYSEWVAAHNIYAGAALAYLEGDPVPTSNVVAHGYDKNGLVKKATAEPAPTTVDKPVDKKKNGEGA